MVVGGGQVAQRKVQDILTHQGKVRLISPQLTQRLQVMAEEKLIDWRTKAYAKGDLDGAFLVFAATSNPRVQKEIARDAHQADLLLNLADDPGGCSFHVPASVHRGDLTLAVSTHGKSPAVAAMVRKKLEEVIGEEYGILLSLITLVREQVLAHEGGQQEKRVFFQKILEEDLISWIKAGKWAQIEAHITNVLGASIELDWMSIRENSQ